MSEEPENRIGWIANLALKRVCGAAHVFILHLGVNDVQTKDDQFWELPGFLRQQHPFRDSQFIALFNRADGIHFATAEMRTNFKRLLDILHPQTDTMMPPASRVYEMKRREVDYMFDIFTEMLEIDWQDQRIQVREALIKSFGQEAVDANAKAGKPFFTAIIERVESLAPPQAISSSIIDDRNALVQLLSWGTNQSIGETFNTVILIAENLGAVAEQLSSETNAIMPIEVLLPTTSDRLTVIQIVQEKFPEKNLGLLPEDIARLSAGLSCRNIVQLSREAFAAGRELDETLLFARKKEHIGQQSRGLVELCQSLWGLEAIGGLEDKKELILSLAAAMRSGDILQVPQGILLVGGPGTGKTVFVQALSYVLGLPFAMLQNVREKWVGQSERNQDYILRLLTNYAPLIIFNDELDQELLMRGTVFHGDSGVNARMQKKLLQIMSDTDLRGQILWIAATNRPDLIDQAFLREGRTDIVLPFIPPSAEERAKILPAILHKLFCQAKKGSCPFEHNVPPSFYEEFGWITHGHFSTEKGWAACNPAVHKPGKFDPDEVEFTGGEIEHIIISAYRRARKQGHLLGRDHLIVSVADFIPKRNIVQFRQATDMALVHCNSLELIPPEYRDRARELHARKTTGGPGHYL